MLTNSPHPTNLPLNPLPLTPLPRPPTPQVGCIKPLCDLLSVSDVRIVTVALEGLENILKVGEALRKQPGGSGQNPYAQLVEDAEGLDKIESLQVGGGRFGVGLGRGGGGSFWGEGGMRGAVVWCVCVAWAVMVELTQQPSPPTARPVPTPPLNHHQPYLNHHPGTKPPPAGARKRGAL